MTVSVGSLHQPTQVHFRCHKPWFLWAPNRISPISQLPDKVNAIIDYAELSMPQVSSTTATTVSVLTALCSIATHLFLFSRQKWNTLWSKWTLSLTQLQYYDDPLLLLKMDASQTASSVVSTQVHDSVIEPLYFAQISNRRSQAIALLSYSQPS